MSGFTKSKTSVSPDLNKQAQKVTVSRKLQESSNPEIFFNNAVICANWQKHSGMFLH